MENAPQREFSFEHKKTLTPQDQSALIKAFAFYDKNSDNTMDAKEFKTILVDLGYRKITDDKVKEMLSDND